MVIHRECERERVAGGGGGGDGDRVLEYERVRCSNAVSESRGMDVRCFLAIWVVSVWSYMDTCTRKSRVGPSIESDTDNRNAGRTQLSVV